MTERDLIVKVNGTASEGLGSVLVYHTGPQIEIVTTEEKGSDAAVFLSKKEAAVLVRALSKSLGQ